MPKLVRSLIILILVVGPAMAECGVGDVLPLLRPGAEWNCIGNTYDGLQWLDATQTKPTKAQVDAAIAACQSKVSARAIAKRDARFTVRTSTATAAKKINALILLLDLDQ